MWAGKKDPVAASYREMSFSSCLISCYLWFHSSRIQPMLNLFPKASAIIHLQWLTLWTSQDFCPTFLETYLHQFNIEARWAAAAAASYAEFDLDSEVSSSCVNGVSLATYSVQEMLMKAVKWGEISIWEIIQWLQHMMITQNQYFRLEHTIAKSSRI